MKALILIWSLLLPCMVFGQSTSTGNQYRNDGETLINGSFEQGKKGYTFTVGSGSLVWSTQSTTSLNGKAMQLTLSAQTFSFKSATTQGSKLSGQNGYIEVYLSASASGAEFCPLVDGTSAPTTTPNECQPIIHGVGFKPYGIQKTFGATSLNYEIRGVSNASYTGDIYIDDGSVAKKSVVVNNSGAELYGVNKISGCTTQWSLTSTTYVNFNAQTSCSYSASGRALPDTAFGSTQLPSIKFATLPRGDYLIQYEGLAGNNSSTNTAFRFSDGTNSTDADSSISTNNFIPSFSGRLTTVTDQTNVTIQVQAKAGTGSPLLHGTSLYTGTIRVWRFPPQPISSITTAGGWFIDANIGGALVSLGNSSVASYTEITNASLDMVINSAKGSAPAEIACINGTASTGLTCSGVNESIGIAFIPPRTGRFRACATVSHQTANNGITFQLIETTNTSSAIVAEGGERVNLYSTVTTSVPTKICGRFTFNDTNKKTIRLMFEQFGGGTISQVLADRAVAEGQRDVNFTVEPIVENIQAGLQGYNYTPNTVNVETFSVSYGTTNATTVCSASPCSYLDQIGNAVTSITRTSQGLYSLNTSKAYSKLKCTINARSSILLVAGSVRCENCSSVQLVTDNTSGSSADSYGTILCQGIPQ